MLFLIFEPLNLNLFDGFSKNLFFRKMMDFCFFVTFDIIKSCKLKFLP